MKVSIENNKKKPKEELSKLSKQTKMIGSQFPKRIAKKFVK